MVGNKSKVAKKLSTVNSKNAGKGKCQVMDISGDSVDFLLTREREGKLYVEISCEKDDTGPNSGLWPYAWTGLFPEQLFSSNFELAIDKNFDLKTETVTEEKENKTTFKSSALKSTLVGTWGEELRNPKGQAVTPISVSSEQGIKIYILSN